MVKTAERMKKMKSKLIDLANSYIEYKESDDFLVFNLLSDMIMGLVYGFGLCAVVFLLMYLLFVNFIVFFG